MKHLVKLGPSRTLPHAARWIAFCSVATICTAVPAFTQEQSTPAYSCDTTRHPGDAIGSEIKGESTGAEIALYDETTRSQVGSFAFTGGLWFFDGGQSTEVAEGTHVVSFSFGDYHPGASANLSLCSSGRYFILSSEGRRFRISFPSLGFAALIMEIK